MNDKTGKIVVAHVWNKEKNEYLEEKLKETYIKQWADAECIALGDRYTYWSKEMVTDEGKTAKELLNDGAAELNCDVAVVGMHGRKGLKADPTIMGTAVQYMGLNSTVPVFILKNPIERKNKENEAFRFAAAIDGSSFSMKAITYMAKMKRKQDKIDIVVCEQSNISSGVVIDKCETALYEFGIEKEDSEITFHILPGENGRRPADIIRDFVNDHSEIDFFFVGNKGADFSSYNKNKYLGSVANEMVRNTKVNLFFMT